jgi:hypothetical protein
MGIVLAPRFYITVYQKVLPLILQKGGAEICERSVDHGKDASRGWLISALRSRSLLETIPGSKGLKVAMFLRHRYISHKRRHSIGVKIPLYEEPWSDESTSLNELFSTSSRQGRSLIGISNMFPFPG